MNNRLKTSLARKYYKYISGTSHKIVKVGKTEFCVCPDNYVDRRMWIEGCYEKEQIQTFLNVSKKNAFDAFIDIGTNFGLYSCIVGVENTVSVIHSFECDPRNLYQLYGHIAMNNLFDKIKVHALAAGDKKEQKTFSLAPKDNTGKSKIIAQNDNNSTNVIKVDQVTIDDELSLKNKKLLIKIDVEGYEENVLKGMLETLKNNQCFIQIEILDDVNLEAKKILEDAGYKKIKQIDTDNYYSNMDITL